MKRRRSRAFGRSWTGLTAGCCLAAGTVSAQPEPSARGPAQALPLTDVVLFSSGVGFFERNAQVEGNATVELKFPAKDVNDLLKSLVTQDFDGGKVTAVSYASQDPIEKTLGTFAIDLRSNPTLGGLLGQIRGERIRLSIPDKIEGIIVGVEREEVPVKDGRFVVEKLTLLTDDGLRTIDLAKVQEIKLLRPELEAELQQALKILATGHDSDKKGVTLRLQGAGKRTVRVGYIVESPVWKTSYRLVIGKEKTFLQGWAIVENTTEDDWNGVKLTLVSGRPISFRMDLYSPLYVQRPLVEPELYASLRPQTYGEDLKDGEKRFREQANANRAPEAAKRQMEAQFYARDAKSDALRKSAAAGEGKGEGRDGMFAGYDSESEQVKSVASAGEVGELFRYVIDSPVKIARRQSAMIPIVSDPLEVEKVSIYNEQVHGKHPLNGLKLRNTTGKHLLQGPLTIFDDGTYAGDAKIDDVSPASERLLSYALDLDTEVAAAGKAEPDNLLSVKMVYGTLHVAHRAKTAKTFTVKNGGSKEKKVLIEFPKSADWKLLSPKEPTETTRDRYRFAVAAKPGEPAVLEVSQQREYVQHYAMSNMNDGAIQYYVNLPVSSPAVKKALGELLGLKRELARIVHEKQKRQQEIAQIDQEQNRIRQNLPQLDRSGDLFARYVKKFGEQEDRIETLRKEIDDLIRLETAQQKQIDEFIVKTNLE